MVFLLAVCWIFVTYLLVAFLDYNLLYWLVAGLGVAAIQATHPHEGDRPIGVRRSINNYVA